MGGWLIIDMYELLEEWTGLWNVKINGLLRGTACRQTLHQKRAPRDSPYPKVDTVVRRLYRQYTRHDPKTDGIQLSRSLDLCPSTQSGRTDRNTRANVWDDDGRVSAIQPFSQKSRTATVPKMIQIGLCGVVEADLELFCNSWRAGFLRERLYIVNC